MPPQSATITIQNKSANPSGQVEVTPGGRIKFHNRDQVEYILCLYKDGTTCATGTSIVLPTAGSFTVFIKQDDEFKYDLLDPSGTTVIAAAGPIRN
jgi:hypothetical protein